MHLVASPSLIVDLEDIKYVQLHLDGSGDAPSHGTVRFKDGEYISIDEDAYNQLVLALARLHPQKLMGVVTPIPTNSAPATTNSETEAAMKIE